MNSDLSPLTAQGASLYIDGASKSLGAILRPSQRCGKEVFSFRVVRGAYGHTPFYEPECLGYREVRGGLLKSHLQHSGFFIAQMQKNIFRRLTMTQDTRRWYQPQDASSAVDAIENVKNIIAFLSDTITQEGFNSGAGYSFCEDGITGLYNLYGVIEGVLDDCNQILVKEVH